MLLLSCWVLLVLLSTEELIYYCVLLIVLYRATSRQEAYKAEATSNLAAVEQLKQVQREIAKTLLRCMCECIRDAGG